MDTKSIKQRLEEIETRLNEIKNNDLKDINNRIKSISDRVWGIVITLLVFLLGTIGQIIARLFTK